jgi:CRISPR-associated endonuclease Csn1
VPVQLPAANGAVKRVFGIDLGIASCGWAVVDLENDQGEARPLGQVVSLGSWMFDAPETDKDRTPTNQVRRTMRGQRRVIRRRRQRMNALRKLFLEHDLLPNDRKDALKIKGLDPWALRVAGLDRLLTSDEFAVVLGHIARHRGFKSNKKSDGANAADESSKMLRAIEATREKSATYRTVAEMMVADPAFGGRKRNRSGDFSRSVLRKDLDDEARKIFSAQARLCHASNNEMVVRRYQDLELRYFDIAFSQRPLQDSERMVGLCPFEKDQIRTSKRAPSFELFRYLSRLTALRVGTGRDDRALTPEEIAAGIVGFGKRPKITFQQLRKLIGLDPDLRFAGVAVDDEKHDVAARRGEAAHGTAKLRKAVGESGWASLVKTPELPDRIAEILTFRDAPERIESGLRDLPIDPLIVKAIMEAVGVGAFATFTGAGHISAQAARAVIPFLKQSRVYSDACTQAGYDHAARAEIELKDIGSPVARKAMSEALKQVRSLVHAFGTPDAIHIELARDVGKSKEERDKIKRGIDDRNAEKDRLRGQYQEDIGEEPRTSEDLLRYELWKQQNCRCIYTDDYIEPQHVAATSNAAQVDHILPWSRFGDDSFHNKVLVTAKANQDKRGRTPFEWFNATKPERDWEQFSARVENNKAFRGYKRRNLLLKDAESVAERFRARNLNDTRYASRALADLLTRLYPSGPNGRRVFARPGAVTSKLRQAWGIQDLKKDDAGERIADDRHHALDALVCAATTEGTLQRLTRAFQEAERRGLARELIGMEQPWEGFRDQARAAIGNVFVCRAARHRARGKAHDATIKQVAGVDGDKKIYERKAIEKITLKDLANIKDVERNKPLVTSVGAWIEAGKPKDRLPRSPKGDEIRKLRVLNRAKDGICIRGGIADRGEMVRIDCFEKRNAKNVRQFFLVPVYPHQVAMDVEPPCKFVQSGVVEDSWPSIDRSFDFLWSIYPMSLMEVTKPNGEVLTGYFRGLDRSTGAIHLSRHHSKDALIRSIGARTLLNFRKLVVDRLGNVHEVRHEARTWRGAVCT